MMTEKKQQLAALILIYFFCFNLLHCSKQEQTQAKPDEGKQKSFAESTGTSSDGSERKQPMTATNLSTIEQDSPDDGLEPVPAPFGFIHRNSLKKHSKAFVREAFFDRRSRDVSQAGFSRFFDESVNHELYLEVPDRNLLLARHYWLGEIDIPTGVITFWQPQGDSLQFIPLEAKPYLDFWSEVTIADSMSYAGGALVLVLNSQAGDAGDVWGYYDILRFQKNKPIAHLSHENYEYTDGFDIDVDGTDPAYTTLKCEIVREEKSALKIRYLRDAFVERRDGNDRLVKSDTTYATFH